MTAPGHQETLERLRQLLRDGQTEAFQREVDAILARCTSEPSLSFWRMVRRWGAKRPADLLGLAGSSTSDRVPDGLVDATRDRAAELDLADAIDRGRLD